MASRTTIVLDDHLLQKLRLRAAERGVGLSRAIADLLQAALSGNDPGPRQPYRLRWPVSTGTLQPGVVLEDRDRLLDLMEGRE